MGVLKYCDFGLIIDGFYLQTSGFPLSVCGNDDVAFLIELAG